MSKYTTEVRYICEHYAGLKDSAGWNDVDDILEASYDKIFDVDSIPVFSPSYKAGLFKKILLHYYTREIGFETVGLWKLKLNQKMREIMPYYNQLYESELLEYDPLKNVDNTHTHTGEYEDNSKVDNINGHTNLETRNLTTVDDGSDSFNHKDETILRHNKTIHKENDVTTRADDVVLHGNDTTTHGNDKTIHGDDVTIHGNDTTTHGQDSTTHSVNTAGETWNMFSDTPQGGIDGVSLAGGVNSAGTLADDAYLTNATHITDKPAETTDTTQIGTVTNQYGNVTNEYGDVTKQYGDVTNTYGNITNQYGNITNSYGDVVETYNKTGDQKDEVTKQGWDKTDNTNTHTGTIDNTGRIVEDNRRKDDGTDSYTNREMGKIGTETYQEMVMKYRETFLNIDMMIIRDLGNLFMKVW